TGQVLGLGLVGPATGFFSNTSSPAASTEFLNGQTTCQSGCQLAAGVSSMGLPEQGCCTTAFLTTTLSQLRSAQPTVLTPLPSGVPDARCYRVVVGSATTGTHVEASATAPTASLSANPTSIHAGQSSTLAWSSTNATSCTGGGFSTNGAISGSAAV